MSTLWTQGGKLLINSSNKLITCPGCPCGCAGIPWIIDQPRILFWGSFLSQVVIAQSYYEGLGITVDNDLTWTGNLDDYCLIIWLLALSDPSWLSTVTSGGWRGRIHITGEYGSYFPASNAYVNSLSTYHTMTLGSDSSLGGCYPSVNSIAPSYSHSLAASQPILYHGATSSVSGGNPIYKNPYLDKPMMAQYYDSSRTTDWVVCGDTNHIIDTCVDHPTLNEQFLCNLYTLGPQS